jgi:division protein CdvB (Snf7/Vps24/ESCRT-III family)
VTWWPWRKKLEQSRQAVQEAERLRDRAEEQRRRVEEIAPRVDAVSSSLQKLRTDNHIGPMIDAILRGSE